MAIALHQWIDRNNVLQRPTQQVKLFFKQQPTLYKVALVVNHLFRAVAMSTLIGCLPYSLPMNIGVCLVGSLFYRLTVESNCAHKFALPSFAGALTLPMALTRLSTITSGVGLATFGAAALSLAYFIPFSAYAAYVILTVSYDVDHRPWF